MSGNQQGMFLPERNSRQDWFGIVIAVPEPWVSQIMDARLALGDKAAEKVPPHITIMPPQAVDVSLKEDIFEHLRSVAARHRPFRVTVRGAKSFQPISPVVYLDVVEGANACADLAEDVRFGPLDYSPRFPYHPHITLAHGVNQAALDEALALGSDFEASWMVTGFRLDKVDRSGNYASAALFNFS